MNNLDDYIKQAEEKWFEQLSSYCAFLFNNVNIPSHDHTHHLRVWKYAKDILRAIQNLHEIDYELVQAALIASMFHDTGLTVTLNENHGKESRNICIEYFEKNKIQKPAKFEDILLAIENHDDKNYKNSDQNPFSLLSIICNADDLDAFDNIGIVRYTEIYLMRGITLEKLPEAVLKNLENRFSNFERTYKKIPDLYKMQKARYIICEKFFEKLKSELI